MRTIYLTFLLFFISFYSFSQEANSCEWFVPTTANNAVIAIQQANSNNYNFIIELSGTQIYASMSEIDCPMEIGVFYTNDSGELVCGGFTQWDNSQSMAIAAWGDDPTTVEKDGFSDNEPFIFKLCVDGLGELLQYDLIMSTDTPFSDCYTTNGFGSIDLISFEALPMESWVQWAQAQDCVVPIDISENDINKHIVKTMDIYGREIISTINNSGFFFHVYSDKTISKLYKF